MRASIFIFKLKSLLYLGLGIALLFVQPARAADDPASLAPAGKSSDRSLKPEEDDFSQTPYTEYGSFNEEREEEADTKFFQYGRFFGLSLGLGLETADGNRGTLYQGGFPTVNARINYWFDFNFALDLDFYLAKHYFVSSSQTFNGRFDVNMARLGIDVRYYFETKNLSSAITFANPYVLIGAGNYTKSTSASSGQAQGTATDSSVGFNAGAGFEFALKPRKVYFSTEGKLHLVSFSDSNTTAFQSSEGLADLHGNFYTLVASVMFTW